MRPRSISVMLVDDHAVVREGYRRLLEKHEGIVVVAEAADAASAYQAYKNKNPDVVVMDVSLPGRGGIDAIRQIRQWDPAARLLVFTMHLSTTFALQAFRAGAKGFVTKSSPPELLVSACARWLPAVLQFAPRSVKPLQGAACRRMQVSLTLFPHVNSRYCACYSMAGRPRR